MWCSSISPDRNRKVSQDWYLTERLALGAQPGEVMFEDQGVKVFVDPGSLRLIDGTTVDFVKQGLNEAFKFRNPNVKGECGCGESFSV